jgi:hypothetical protein
MIQIQMDPTPSNIEDLHIVLLSRKEGMQSEYVKLI